MFRDVLMCIFGRSGQFYGKFVLKLATVGIAVQLVCHMPFIYYIGKEHMLQCFDEYFNGSLSKMVDRIKGVKG